MAINPRFVPAVFRFARVKPAFVLAAFAVVFVGAAVALAAGFYVLPGKSIDLAATVGLVGAAADIVAVVGFLLTLWVEHYSFQRYERKYDGILSQLEPKWTPDERQTALKAWYTELKNTTGAILKTSFGATLVAIGTFLALVADFVKGV